MVYCRTDLFKVIAGRYKLGHSACLASQEEKTYLLLVLDKPIVLVTCQLFLIST